MSSAELERLWQSNPHLEAVWKRLPRKTIPAGAHVFRAGQVTTAVWHVEKGLLRLYYLSAEGLERNRSFHCEGHWVGPGVPGAGGASPFSAEALERTTIVELGERELTALEADGVVREQLRTTLARVFRLASQREAQLLRSAEEQYLDFLAHWPELAKRVPLRHVALHLGITNVALSRIRRRLGLTRPKRRSNAS